MKTYPVIVCYAGGTAGDLMTAVIDNTDCSYDSSKNKLKIGKERSLMKKFYLFKERNDKINYIKNIFQTFKSLPSHDVDFHTRYKEFNTLGITCFDEKLRFLSSKRFKILHSEKVWESLQEVSLASTIEEYSNNIFEISKKIQDNFIHIDLLEVLKGDLINFLEKNNFKISAESKSLYNKWLEDSKKRLFYD